MNHDILLVDDDPGAIQLMGRILAGVGKLRFATNGRDALRLASEAAPDLILLDAEMPGLSGFEVLGALKADPALADVPVIFVTSHAEPDFEVAGLELGAADFIAKPVHAPLLLTRVKTQLRLKHLADALRRVAMTDSLTGLANRRSLDEALAREWRLARRNGHALALLMIDVDHFKQFNDCYGHPAGDACLEAVARAAVGVSMRPTDLVARIGGEEFVMLLPHTPREGAGFMAQRVLEAVGALAIEHANSPSAGHVTVSIGVACYDEASGCWVEPSGDSGFASRLPNPCSMANLMRAADLALYAAKHGGRAQAWLLDIADIDAPTLAQPIPPAER